MSTKSKAVLVSMTGFIMILSALFFMTLPILSISTIDFGNPLIAKWELKEGGSDKNLVVKYDGFENFNEVVYRFQKLLYLPFEFTVKESFTVSAIMIFVFIFFIGSFISIENDDHELFRLILPAAILIALALIAAPLIGNSIYDVSDRIRASIADKTLANAVVKDYWEDLILRMFFSIIGMVLAGAIVLVIAGLTRVKIWEEFIIGNIYTSWKEKVFADILKNRRESLLSEFIAENRGNIDEATENVTRVLNTKNEVLQILPNGTIELVRFNYRLEWTPLPIFVLTKEVVSSISVNNFFRYMMADSKDIAFTELREKLLKSYEDRFGQAGENAITTFVSGLIGEARNRFGEIMSAIREKELRASSEYAEKTIQIVVNKSLRKFKAEVAKVGTDEMNFILSNFRERLIKEVHSRMTVLFSNQDSSRSKELRILPQGTRFHIQKGDYDFLVVEQNPQIRTVSVSSRLSGKNDRDGFNLAFPYVVFFLIFKQEQLTGFFAHYRSRPLTSLDDMLCRPNLPNMNESSVCLDFNGHNTNGLVARTEEVIGHFWNSQFNTDWTSNYERYAENERRLKNFSVWEQNSRENPLFTLDIQWETLFSVRDIIVRYASDIEEFSSRFGEEEIKAAFAITEDDMREALMKQFGKIKVKNKYPDIISSTIRDHREEVINQSFGSVEASFNYVTGSDTLDRTFQDIMDKSINETLEHDFVHLAGEVLIRRRIEPNELIDKIREGR